MLQLKCCRTYYLQEVRSIDSRIIREENGFFYITETKEKIIPKSEALKQIQNSETIPNEREGIQTNSITENPDSYVLITIVTVKVNCYNFLDIASSIREGKDKLENAKKQLEITVNGLKELDEEWLKFKPFVDQASLIKKKAHFREQRRKK